MRILSKEERLVMEVERVLCERQWLPLYEANGPEFIDHVHDLRIERQYPPNSASLPNDLHL